LQVVFGDDVDDGEDVADGEQAQGVVPGDGDALVLGEQDLGADGDAADVLAEAAIVVVVVVVVVGDVGGLGLVRATSTTSARRASLWLSLAPAGR
jgi:hypothetical protein